MTEMMRTLADAPRAVLTSDTKVFGLSFAEILFLGMLITSLATGPWSDLERPSEIFHWHNLVSALATIGFAFIQFATGRMSSKKDA